jgi:dipeptidyl aminopeptidase/acylaminoacyl peptidase
VELCLHDREAHGFIDERNRIDFHEKLSAFFERHPGPAGPSGRGSRGARCP